MHETIRGLYEGILDPEAWQRSLALLCEKSGSEQAALVVLDTGRERVLVSQVVNALPEVVGGGNAHYAALDQALLFAPEMPVGGWYIASREPEEDTVRRLPMQGQLLREFGMSSLMVCLVERQPKYETYLVLQRVAGHSAYSQEDARALDWAIPHLRQAIALRERTLEFTTLTHISFEVLERLPFGVIVFDGDGEPLMSNRAGEHWVHRLVPALRPRAGDVLPGHGRYGDGWQLSRPFAEVLRAAADPGSMQPARALRATGTDGRQAQVIVLPLPPTHPLAMDSQRPTVLVAVHETSGSAFAIPALLRELYRLTPAETRLASLMTTGIGLPEACEQLCIRHETGRTQLKAIFYKTGTGTQAQLAHLLTRLSGMLAAA